MRTFRFGGLLAAVAVGLATSPSLAHVDLIAPNGTEVLDAGSVFTVEWEIEIAHNLQNWDLWYSTTSSSGPWIEFASDLPAGSGAVGSRHSYEWTIPDILSDDTWARVRMDNTEIDYYGVSDASFAIVPKPDSDLTNNGFVDFADLTLLLANWGKTVTAAEGNIVGPGGAVDFADLTRLLADWGPAVAGSPEAAGAEAVPEPSGLVLLAMATLGLSFYRRRRRRTF